MGEEVISVDYTEYIDGIEGVLAEFMQSHQETMQELIGRTEEVTASVERLQSVTEQLGVFNEYTCGIAVFFVAVVLVYFAYKLLRIFF